MVELCKKKKGKGKVEKWRRKMYIKEC